MNATFGEALKKLKKGWKVARSGWNERVNAEPEIIFIIIDNR